MQAEIRTGIEYLWIVIGIVWLLSAPFAKGARQSQSLASLAGHSLFAVAGFVLVFHHGPGFGILGFRLLPDTAPVAQIGLVLALAGTILTLWARLSLGANLSAQVEIKNDHRLIRRGPYGFVRHPIYAGLLLALLGTAVAGGELRCLLGLLLAGIGFWQKSRLEEQFLMRQFGRDYETYRADVRALIPYIL
jgi:protein-S-isoprenylcysteine O-methyltransferase Ste14